MNLDYSRETPAPPWNRGEISTFLPFLIPRGARGEVWGIEAEICVQCRILWGFFFVFDISGTFFLMEFSAFFLLILLCLLSRKDKQCNSSVFVLRVSCLATFACYPESCDVRYILLPLFAYCLRPRRNHHLLLRTSD